MEDGPVYECDRCGRRFNVKSNLTRHAKTHESKLFICPVCDRAFTLKCHLDRHSKQHLLPAIPLFKNGEARLKCSGEALAFSKRPGKPVDDVWLDPRSAETAAKKSGPDMWQANVVVTFGKYAGKTFKWLIENDVGWVVWLLAAYCGGGEKNPLLLWQKKQLLEWVSLFPSVMVHLDKRLKVNKQKNSFSCIIREKKLERVPYTKFT